MTKKDTTPGKNTAPETPKSNNSYAYKLGYASTMNQSRIGYNLVKLIEEQKTRSAMITVIKDYCQGVDHARERLNRTYTKARPLPEKDR